MATLTRETSSSSFFKEHSYNPSIKVLTTTFEVLVNFFRCFLVLRFHLEDLLTLIPTKSLSGGLDAF